ncbi:MAG: tRNA (adenosine(37)-N6)-threonylcarbamoyltransferase complex dimerization subunit type 1 TsaB [Elusimicrobia bacterium]|nr:tRNA (adenosine(37)-N6)-threonylcarbamoyltransferase complex dimerization subunit type 1 TsaB [Elusimicrobiota bacterium]
MKILALDTTSPFLGIALWGPDGGKEICRRVGNHHDEVLVKHLKGLLHKSKWRMEEIDRIVVATGPGRFTGIRIGLTFANMLSETFQKPVTGISTLEALAYQAALQRQGKKDLSSDFFYICSLVESIREEVFWQLFEWKSRCKTPLMARTQPCWTSVERVKQIWDKHPQMCCVGSGISRLAGLVSAAYLMEPKSHVLKASSLALLVLNRGRRPMGLARPLYLKPGHYEIPRGT